MKKASFSDRLETNLKKAQLGYTPQAFLRLALTYSLVASLLLSGFVFVLLLAQQLNIVVIVPVFLGTFMFAFLLISLIPALSVKSKKIMLETDLLYSTRHLLLKLESGSSLANSIESVSKLKTTSSVFFKEIVMDISLGLPVEDALEKAIEYSPSKAFIKILEEILNSLKTGSDIRETLRATLQDVTRQHLIHIKEYGRKLNPMSMFYMIVGTIAPSLGTAMLVVASSLLSGAIIIDIRILLGIVAVVAVIQLFFILGFRSLKPAVME